MSSLPVTEDAVANKAMEGDGFYNRNSNLQAAGIELVLPLLEQAARSIPIDAQASTPLVIADYGSSQGRNSMRPIRHAIQILRERVGPDRQIEVVHTDLPSNDFASLFTTLQEDSGSYLSGQSGVFPSAIGRSYFEPILPARRVHLGWNSWTLHWLSRNPVEVPDHVSAGRGFSESARDAVRRQQAQDWENFLAARSAEMADGAMLVTMMVGRTAENSGWQWPLDELWNSVKSMAEDGLLSSAELMRFTFPSSPRSREDLEAPFAAGPYMGLTLEHAAVIEAPDPFWDEYLQTKNAAKLGKQWAGMLRAITGPLAAVAFASRPDAGALVDELFQRLESRAAAEPRKNLHFAAVAVVRKTGVGAHV